MNSGEIAELLLNSLPPDGTTVGNRSAREKLNNLLTTEKQGEVDESTYYAIRSLLLEDGRIELGRGRGGSLRRVLEESNAPVEDDKGASLAEQSVTCFRRESDLYGPFHSTINKYFVNDYRIRDFVSQITANQGSRSTGGKWTRPDVSLVAIKKFQYIPGMNLEVITFEIKPEDAYGIEGVFETASHSVFANTSYLCIHTPKELPDSDLERLDREAARFGVGLMLFEDPSDWDTFEVRVEPELQTPDPERVNDFISQQFSEPNKQRVAELVR